MSRQYLGISFSYDVTVIGAATNYGVLRSASGALLPSYRDLPQTRALSLPRRQREVLALLAQGHSNKQIAMALGVSEKTVKVHVSILFQKLGVTSRTAAAIVGLRWLQAEPSRPESVG